LDEKFLNQLLAAAVKSNASDIHLKVGAPPVFRMGGELKEVKAPRMMPEDTRNAALLLIANEQANSGSAALWNASSALYLTGYPLSRTWVSRRF